jgi:hypothetical protein
MGWPDIVSAIASAIIAVVLVAAGLAAVGLARELRGVRALLERLVGSFDSEGRPALQSARQLIDDASKVVAAVRAEADGVVATSRDVRERTEALVRRAEARLRDLDALVDVVQYELEETALDVAAALRTTRRGASVFRAMKRAFLGRGR